MYSVSSSVIEADQSTAGQISMRFSACDGTDSVCPAAVLVVIRLGRLTGLLPNIHSIADLLQNFWEQHNV